MAAEFVEIYDSQGGTHWLNTSKVERVGGCFLDLNGCWVEVLLGSSWVPIRVDFDKIGGPGLDSRTRRKSELLLSTGSDLFVRIYR